MDLLTGATGQVGGRLAPRLIEADRIVEIGGADVLTCRDMIVGHAGRRGLRDDVIVRVGSALRLVPVIRPLSCAEAFDGGSLLVQTAHFAPHGLGGRLCWHALTPLHAAIFGNLARCVAERARSLARAALPGSEP